MIKINNKDYDKETIEVVWGPFYSVSTNNEKITGMSPLITLNLENSISIGLEFLFSDELFKKMCIGKRTNLKTKISDILYDGGKGWTSLMDGEYDCFITKVNEQEFKIECSLTTYEITIQIDTNVKLF